jgi:hypothetical protein
VRSRGKTGNRNQEKIGNRRGAEGSKGIGKKQRDRRNRVAKREEKEKVMGRGKRRKR